MRAENIKSSCLSIAAAIRCIKSVLSVKGIPTDVYIKTTQQLREIERENQRIRKAVWRKKYLRAANIKPMVYTYSLSNGEANVYR